MRDTAYKVLQARERLLRQQQREPTVEQIAQELELPREEVVFAMDAMSAPVSLYEPVYADGGDAVCVMDQIRDDHSSDEGWLQQLALKDAISHLQPRERNILALRFCQGKTQMEVSSEIGISQAQVSRLEKMPYAPSSRSCEKGGVTHRSHLLRSFFSCSTGRCSQVTMAMRYSASPFDPYSRSRCSPPASRRR